jgi:hypothetical protein
MPGVHRKKFESYDTSCRFRFNLWVKVVREKMPAHVLTIALPEMVYERIRQGARPTMPTDQQERLAAVHEK